MVYHLSLRDTASLLPSVKYCTSSRNKRARPKLLANRPPCLLAQFWTLEVIRRGWSPSINTLYKPIAGGVEEEAMLEPTISIGPGLREALR
nr:hypothetical protein CFP56_77217 [Quercus suber]